MNDLPRHLHVKLIFVFIKAIGKVSFRNLNLVAQFLDVLCSLRVLHKLLPRLHCRDAYDATFVFSHARKYGQAGRVSVN